MATLTTWEAEKGGYFQGSPTIGAAIGNAIDWFIQHIRKLPQLPKVQLNQGHWKTWPDGEPLAIGNEWIDEMIAKGKLPPRDQVTYVGTRPDDARARAIAGTHVIIELLDTDRRTRHKCIYHRPNLLTATREGWDASLSQ